MSICVIPGPQWRQRERERERERERNKETHISTQRQGKCLFADYGRKKSEKSHLCHSSLPFIEFFLRLSLSLSLSLPLLPFSHHFILCQKGERSKQWLAILCTQETSDEYLFLHPLIRHSVNKRNVFVCLPRKWKWKKGKRGEREKRGEFRSKMDNKSTTNYCCYYLSWMHSIDSLSFWCNCIALSFALSLSLSPSLYFPGQNEQVDQQEQNRTRITLMCVRLIWPARQSLLLSLWWQREASLIQLPGESLFHFLFLCGSFFHPPSLPADLSLSWWLILSLSPSCVSLSFSLSSSSSLTACPSNFGSSLASFNYELILLVCEMKPKGSWEEKEPEWPAVCIPS